MKLVFNFVPSDALKKFRVRLHVSENNALRPERSEIDFTIDFA